MIFSNTGKNLIFIGIVLIIIGIVIILLNKFHISNLPGDFIIKNKNTTIYIPIMSSIILSVVISIILNLYFRFFKGQ